MRKSRLVQWKASRSAMVGCTYAVALLLLTSRVVAAQPVPSTATPTHTHTATATDTAVPVPSDTPRPTWSATPEVVSLPTSTVAAPTATSEPTSGGETPEPAATFKPDCQSEVTGTVYHATGRQAGGCTVLIEGDDWFDGMMTDDEGGYAFRDLCAGDAVLQAYLPDGQASQPAAVSLDGRSKVHLDLRILASGTGSAPGSPAALETPSDEPDMPATGYATWWLYGGGTLLAALLLVSAGARRMSRVRMEAEDRDQ